MKSMKSRIALVCIILMALLVVGIGSAQEPPPQRPPANVAGKWTIYSKGSDGKTATKTIELKQNGNILSGHFKGPYQSGGLEGSVNEQHITFHTKTREVLYFQGRVDGDRIVGTFHDRTGHGEWQAVRTGN
ncbi:MAG TPA: hypothetical protein VMT51_11035 [Dongiaceae bacterium]|nr:hypothetical protein [Dongiaceae bacterium]